jgi:hypothetical protein
MLTKCPACEGVVSDQATACPHCGHPLAAAAPVAAQVQDPHAVAVPMRRSPIFTILAMLGFVLCLFTPRLILILPLFGTVACAVVGLFRKERFRWMSGVALLLSVILLFASASGAGSGATASDLAAVKVDDWNWGADPEFGSRGAIKWNVNVRNVSDRYVQSVKVELTTFDRANKLIASDFTYVDAIPPGGTRSVEATGDYYGNEANATLQVTDVNFVNP